MKAPLQTKAKTSSNAPPTFTPVRSGLLQRKCACGGTPGPTGECESCRKKKLQRRSENRDLSSSSHPPSSVSEVPPIVHDVLRSPGEPLDAETRAFMEPHFGHDFGTVRVHTDTQAAESARAVDALAYTIGSHVAFGPGRYAPESSAGRQLLAHELAHVVQQRAGVHLKDGIGQAGDAYEVQADAMAASMPLGPSMPSRSESASNSWVDGTLKKPTEPLPLSHGPIQFQTDDQGKPDPKTRRGLDPTSNPALGVMLEAEQRAKMLPVSAQKIQENETGPANYAGKKLGAAEAIITGVTGKTADEGSDLVFKEGPHFVLHDTAGRPEGSDTNKLQGDKETERGPLGITGAAAFIPFTKGEPLIVRPNLFTSQRVTATGYEKRLDKTALADREIAFQQIWKATEAKAQTQALNDALTGFQLTSEEKETAAEESARAIAEGKLTQKELGDEKVSAVKQLTSKLPVNPKPTDKPKIFTTAAWTIQKICETFKGASAAKKSEIAADAVKLGEGCDSLSEYFSLREQRLGSSVNVEISQKGIKPDKLGCSPNQPPLPAYTKSQYEGVMLVYLLAALQAKQFPEITTHYWTDKEAGDHCDPRCFHLNHLYNLIAAQLGHAKGSTYGIEPNPGTTHAKNNLWWSERVCGGKYPSE